MLASRIVTAMVLAMLVTLPLTGCSNSDATPPPRQTPSTGGAPGQSAPGSSAGASEGQQLVETKCKMCHTLDRVQQADKTAEEWQQTVTRMQRNGLVVTEDEKAAILEYLSAK